LLLAAVCATRAFSQAGGGGAGGGRVIGGGNVGGIIGAGGNITIPGNVTIGGGGAITAGPRIIADSGILVGNAAQATVVVVTTNTTSTGGTQVGVSTATSTYQWTISGGKITTDATRATISYVADAAGTVLLNVVVTTNGTAESAAAQVTAVSADLAGTITAPGSVATSTASVAAKVPAAQDGDRTFRWIASGGTIASGQGTESVTLKPGSPGLLEVSCDVTLQRIVTVTLHAFVVITGDGAMTALAINGGDGGGTYPAGSRVDIFASAPPAGQVFDKWTGDTSVLGTAALAPSFAHAVVTLPATGTTLTATYKAAPAWTPVTIANFNPITQTGTNNTTTTVSTTLVDYIPAGAQGIVVLLHSTGGKASDWFTLPEQVTLTRDLVAAGYGVAALNSVNRNTGAWNGQATLANNPDAANVAAALDKFAKDGALAATKPVFLLGLAAGADAAARYGDLLATTAPTRPVKGVVLYCATGGQTLAVTSHVPELFALAANDATLGTAGNAEARTNERLLAGRGVAAGLTSNGPSPILKGRFRTLGSTSSTFTNADADAIWTAVNKAGLLDANSYLKSIPTADALKTALGTTYQARATDVAEELAVSYAAQEFYSDIDARVINFLNNRAADAAVPAPGRIVNLSTRTKLAYLGDTFTLGFNISGTAKAQLLVRGIGPALKKFGLDGALVAPRLEINQSGKDTPIAFNEGWSTAANAAQIASAAASVGAFALDAGALDTAVLLTLDAGTYTATIKGLNGAVGDVLAEVYDVSRNATRLTNLSTLGKITTEGDLLVPGITLAGNSPRTLLIRAVGPGLTDFGLGADAVLGDPRITVLSGTTTVATNNNWAQGGANGQALTLNAAFPAVGAFALKATNPDSALVDALAVGSYTLQAGAAPLPAQPAANFVAPNQTGSVLVEIYEVP